jgi:putative two-component system response regulator
LASSYYKSLILVYLLFNNLDPKIDMNTNLNAKTIMRNEKTMSAEELLLGIVVHQIEVRVGGGGNRAIRFQQYIKILAEQLKEHPRFSSFLSGDNIKHLIKSAPLLDIGNSGVPDRILLKPGVLTDHEFQIVKKHTKIGLDIIVQAEQGITQSMVFFNILKEMVYHHHERWDGSGYPEALSGDAIPCSARLAMVIDVYDALLSRRIYKPTMTHTQAVDIILSGKGSQFDPDVVSVFSKVQDEFYRIANTFGDTEKDFRKRLDHLELAIGEEP